MWSFPQIVAVVFTQLAAAYYLGNNAPMPVLVLAAYSLGGFATANLFLANHELSHNLVFENTTANRALGLFANLPVGIPFSVAFKRYHMEHHLFQGHDGVDTDIPTKGEAAVFSVGGALLKTVWVMGQLFFYALRPMLVSPKPMKAWDCLNLVTQVGFDFAFVYLAGPRAMLYLLLSVFLGGGLHPIAGHFISEHYVFEPGQETYSYYGPLNFLVYNVGYHNEHHDFPKVPGSRLHKIREIAPEYYDTLKFHTSWTKVIFEYIMDPSMGPFSRTMRRRKSAKSD
jgi:sphingolipid 4-desaturase/C4-monooxygenase